MKIRRSRPRFGLFVAIALVSLLACHFAQAGSATWNLNPTSGDWNTATNWTPAVIPNGPSDTASFGTSNTTGVSLSDAVEVNGIAYNPGASGFTVTVPAALTISGAGITNTSGAVQSVVVMAEGGQINLTDDATAGDLISLTNTPDIAFGTDRAVIEFEDRSSAGSAVITNQGGNVKFSDGGLTEFSDNSTAANATITNQGGNADDTFGGATGFVDSANAGNAIIMSEPANNGGLAGTTSFYFTSSAGSATVIAYGADSASGFGATTTISGTTLAGISTLGNATLIAYGNGLGGHTPGQIVCDTMSDGGTAHVELYGDGTLDITEHDAPGLTIGSLSGDGIVSLSGNNLTVGNGNFDSKFDGAINGVIREGGGSLTKIGTGTLTLTQGNSYFAGTTIKAGYLVAHNRTGSATGTGAVQVLGGTLAGDGIIAGAVVVGGSSHKAALSAGTSLRRPGVLTIQGLVTFNASANYKCGFRSDALVGAEVVAGGVSINGASFSLVDSGTATLAPGTVFTVISNTSANPISGTFSNLPDGAIVTVNRNNLQANYEGGDGNDLTLTVVP